MKLDIYRRSEAEHKLSYLAVPSGQPIPQEADNVDWHVENMGAELDVSNGHIDDYAIDDPMGQIREKGYAITSVTHQVPEH
ncbi:DUF6139 family protein [Ramlibacter humi]|uniref:Uncharacterized protein n=1 Tax=Ramlibacter humi TaxID=2530451 RepID=A0A4Z0C8W6_9BURK|nr:DUF6139 family protein [Ramlibacter humi]TFZ08116.1 hypothetical protein EZ216_02825 [Ramlibacter humi]